jgi:hypothetical protein
LKDAIFLDAARSHYGCCDNEHVVIYITDGDHAEEVCNAEKVKVENKIQEVEDLVTVCHNCTFVCIEYN